MLVTCQYGGNGRVNTWDSSIFKRFKFSIDNNETFQEKEYRIDEFTEFVNVDSPRQLLVAEGAIFQYLWRLHKVCFESRFKFSNNNVFKDYIV